MASENTDVDLEGLVNFLKRKHNEANEVKSEENGKVEDGEAKKLKADDDEKKIVNKFINMNRILRATRGHLVSHQFTMAGPAHNYYFPGAEDDLARQLAETLELLRSSYFPIDGWTQQSLLDSFLSVKSFISCVKIVCAITEQAARDDIFALGLFKFCGWLTTPEGAEQLETIQKQATLRKRARPGQEVGTVALFHILSQQLSDFLEEKKGRRFELEDGITELRLWIAMKQAELARDITRLDTEFRPASEYKQMDEQDLTRLFFEKYEEECRRDEKEAAPLSESLLEMVRTRYANEVRESHMYEFCRVDGRKQLLLDYAHQKIAFAVQVGEPRVANSFRRYLAAAGGEMFDEVREEVEVRPPIPRAASGGEEAGPTAQADGRNDGQERGIAIREPEAGVLRPVREQPGGSIPHARNAIRLLADASEKPPGSLLRRQFTVPTAREALLLPAGLRSQFTVPI
ncbi:hypothetical protein H0E87_014776 [Populus deltoides]|uniref:Uncharacterized protein n=1 Tax=Populus deltoides TaxID=3696 RepID=A0A8T2YEM5_POPDE|nr:hypothetical protein H0E87_014776 [Populus deltoides]